MGCYASCVTVYHTTMLVIALAVLVLVWRNRN